MSQKHDPFEEYKETEVEQSHSQPHQTEWMQEQDSGWHTDEVQLTREEVWRVDPTISSQEIVQSPRSADRANSQNNLRSRNSSRSNFIPPAAGGYLEGTDNSSPLSSRQKDGRSNHDFLDSAMI
jgi:hypothetical protein